MQRGSRVVAALAVALVMGQGAAAAPGRTCATPSELAALEMRVLQTELMVAALSCEQHQRYNQFATIYRNELVRHGGALRKYFARVHARDSASRLNGLVTRLANEASQRTYQDGAFCQEANRTFDHVLGTRGADLTRLAAARPTADSHGIAPCTQEASTGAQEAATRTPPIPGTRPAFKTTN